MVFPCLRCFPLPNAFLVFDQLRALQLNAHQIAGILTSNWASFNRHPDVVVVTALDFHLHCPREEENDQDRLQCLYKVAYYYHALALKGGDKNAVDQAIRSYQMVCHLIHRHSLVKPVWNSYLSYSVY